METNSSLSYIMPNLLIGLCKGARSLKTFSKIFHDQLGYDFFRLELKFLLSIGRNINPDAIVISTKLGNTLLFEWTETNNSSIKLDQLNRYSKIKSSDLINVAAIPPTAAKTHDVVLILRPEATGIFEGQLSNNGRLFPILTLNNQGNVISLSKAANSFQAPATDEFFTNGIQTDWLPRYLPFSLETCHLKEMVPFVVQQLVSLLVKDQLTISLPHFCRGFVPAWDLIGHEKQKEISANVKGLTNDLARKGWGSQLLKRHGDNPPSWDLSPEVFKKNPKAYRKHLNGFIAEVRGETYQPGLDFGPDA